MGTHNYFSSSNAELQLFPVSLSCKLSEENHSAWGMPTLQVKAVAHPSVNSCQDLTVFYSAFSAHICTKYLDIHNHLCIKPSHLHALLPWTSLHGLIFPSKVIFNSVSYTSLVTFLSFSTYRASSAMTTSYTSIFFTFLHQIMI